MENPSFEKLESSKERSVPTQALNPIGSSSRNSKLETLSDIKTKNLSRNPNSQNNNKNGKPEFWKTRIFKGTIGSNMSIEFDRKFESELETSNDIKTENTSRKPDLQNKNKNGKPGFWKLESSKERLVPARALNPIGSSRRNSKLQTT